MNKEKIVIAFVDDQPEVVRSLKMIYRHETAGYQVYGTTKQEDLLNYVRNNSVHVVISDMQMPGMTGSELLCKIRTISPNTMRILLTGYAEKQNILKSINDSQVFRFMTKPWNNDELKEKIKFAASISQELYAYENNVENRMMDDNISNVLFIGEKNVDLLKKIKYNTHTIYTAQTPSEALVLLSRNQDIRVIILHEESYAQKNVQSHYSDFLTLLKMLKNKQPFLISIVVGNFNNADIAIELINQGQVYRLLEEPIRKEVICSNLDEAIKYSKLLINHPELAVQHAVDDINVNEFQLLEKHVDLSLLNRISSKLSDVVKNIPFFGRFFGSNLQRVSIPSSK